jgi:large subunit ribosomal protein L3
VEFQGIASKSWCFRLTPLCWRNGSAPGISLADIMMSAGLNFVRDFQDPGRIWPGKKMAGRMGGKRITTQNLHVVRIDNTLDLVFVRGCVPGSDDAHVLIRDAKKRMVASAQHNQAKGLYEKVLPKGVLDLPFPAGTEELAKNLPPIVIAPSKRTTSPFIPRE